MLRSSAALRPSASCRLALRTLALFRTFRFALSRTFRLFSLCDSVPLSHTHTHTHTHTQSLSLSHTHTQNLSISHARRRTLSLSRSPLHAPFHSLVASPLRARLATCSLCKLTREQELDKIRR